MPDDKTKRGGQGRARVASMEDHEVEYLAQTHGATQKAVKEAVRNVGASRATVEPELRKSR